jgi:hypothetical protein
MANQTSALAELLVIIRVSSKPEFCDHRIKLVLERVSAMMLFLFSNISPNLFDYRFGNGATSKYSCCHWNFSVTSSLTFIQCDDSPLSSFTTSAIF